MKKKIHKKNKKKGKKLVSRRPLSINILLSYISLLGTVYFLFFLFPTTVLFGLVLEDIAARLLNLSFVIVIGAMIYGIVKQRLWSFYLALIWFGFEIFNSILSMFLVRKEELIAGFMTTASIYVIIINIIIIWFVYNKKPYFTHKHLTVDIEDKIYIFAMAIWIILMVILVSSSATQIYVDTTYISRDIISGMNNKNLDQALFQCSQLYGQEKDVCYIVIGVAYEDAPISLCNNVHFSFYKATCIRAIKS